MGAAALLGDVVWSGSWSSSRCLMIEAQRKTARPIEAPRPQRTEAVRLWRGCEYGACVRVIGGRVGRSKVVVCAARRTQMKRGHTLRHARRRSLTRATVIASPSSSVRARGSRGWTSGALSRCLYGVCPSEHPIEAVLDKIEAVDRSVGHASITRAQTPESLGPLRRLPTYYVPTYDRRSPPHTP